MIDTNFTLSNIEQDTIGEIMNISMGAAAAALSTLIDRKVTITAPEVKLVSGSDYDSKAFASAVCTEVRYQKGLNGSNYMIMKQPDVKLIVAILSNSKEEPDDGALNEMHLSAIGEVMNQMMGSASTALSSFFGHKITISIPDVFEVGKLGEKIMDLNLDTIVMVRFKFTIEDVLDSEFFSLMPSEFTKDLVKKVLNNGHQAETKEKREGGKKKKPKPSGAYRVDEMSNKTANQNQANTNQNQVNVKPLKLCSFDDEQEPASAEYSQPSFDLIMDVPLEITVEIGHARKLVKEILEIQQGNIIELDKQAGDPVDIIVNGQLLARGDVVVVDDNFGVRITEIVSRKNLFKA